MPKVVIKEIDNTSAGVVSSENFSVVIPGFVKTGTHEVDGETIHYGYSSYNSSTDNVSIFDENGIYECSSQSDFEKYIGKVATAGTAIAATAPTISKTYTGEALKADPTIFFTDYPNQVYLITETEAASEETAKESVGYLRGYTEASGAYTLQVYERVTAWSEISDDGNYAIITTGNEGNDATAAKTGVQYGNQMAYLLLGLGYTVLYLKIDALADLIDSTLWEPLKDRSIYDFRYLCSGLLKDSDGVKAEAVNSIMKDVAENLYETKGDDGRGDCIALFDISQTAYAGKRTAAAIAAIKEQVTQTSTYGAYIVPSVTYSEAIEDEDYADNCTFPGSMHYLVCAAKSMASYPEWYAVSGYTRGVGNLTVVGTGIKLGDAAVNEFQLRGDDKIDSEKPAVNIIVNLNGNYYLWGNRTAYYDASKTDLVASDFLNIRQLCCTLKKQIYTTCRHLMFDPNSDILWLNFINAISPTLEDMKANQGIKDYSFEKQSTSKKGVLFAAIRIVPIEAVEDFEIGVTLEDSLGETTVTLNESYFE